MAAHADEDARVRLLRIAREAAESGSTLPGEFEIARRLDVTRGQVRNLLTELEQRGILRRQQGAATVVDPVALGLATRLEDQLEYSVLLQRMGFVPSVEVLEWGLAPLPSSWTPALNVPTAATALRIVKRWRADGAPVMIAENFLALPPDADVDALLGADGELPTDSLFALVRRVWSQPAIWEISRPGARAADAETAALLEVDAGTALLTMQNVGVTHDGVRVYFATESHLPDAVRYTAVRSFAQPWTAGPGALG